MMTASEVFEGSLVLDSVSWNTLLSGYVDLGDIEDEECVYEWMPERKTVTSNSMIVVLLGRKGCVVKVRRLFDRIEGNYRVSCYKQNGMCEEAFIYLFIFFFLRI